MRYDIMVQPLKPTELDQQAHEALGSPTVCVELVNKLIELASTFTQTDLDRALQLAQLAQNYAVRLGYTWGEGKALVRASWLNALRGKSHKSFEQAAHAFTIANQLDDQALACDSLYILTSLDQQHGQYKSAERGWLDLLASACRMSDLSRKADYLNALGILYGELRDHAQSLCYYQAALQIHIQQDSGLAPLFCNNIADALVQLGNYAEASAFCAKALSTCPEAFVSWRSAMLGTLGKIFLATGEIAQAIHAFEESIRTHQNHETLLNQQVVVQHKTYLGRAHLLQKDFAQALHHAEQGLQLARQTQFKFGEIEALHQIYEIYKHMGALALALDYHEQWITLKQCIMKDKADQRLKFIDATYQVRSQLKRIEQPRVSAAILETHVANRTAQLRQKQGALVLALMLTDAARIS